MKKLIYILLAVVLLVSAGIGSFAQAQTNHQPMSGQKLIGYGPYGYAPEDESEIYYTLFTITNPDCGNDIIIDRISIIHANGTIVYDGQPFSSSAITPHGVRLLRLADYLGSSPDNTECRFYTVEISWSSRGKCLPLIGHVVVFQKNLFGDGTYNLSKTRVAMNNI